VRALLPLPLAAAVALAAAAAAAAPRPAPVSHYAFVERSVIARSGPARDARPVARLRLRTEDGTDELVQVLATVSRGGREWRRVRLPILPNNSTGWVRAGALSRPRTVRTSLYVDRARRLLVLYRDGAPIFRAQVGVGLRGTPTPAGHFYIRDKLTGFPRGTIYGPLAFGTSAKSAVLTDWPRGGVIGIHGTNEPQLLPGRVSHGCIRMRNHDITRLAKLLPIGTPLTIA
jgi:lipoprotein-anchoring transpeptidase ErfK/SrfK